MPGARARLRHAPEAAIDAEALQHAPALLKPVNEVGFAVIGLFIAAWVGAVILYRYEGLDEIQVASRCFDDWRM